MKTWIKILLVTGITGLVALYAVYRFVYNKPHPDYLNEKECCTMDAGRLYHEFKEATAAASKKYNGQVIRITGALSKTEVADSLVVAVFVFSNDDFGDEGIRCTMLPGFNDKAKDTPAGTAISLKGYCTGFNGTDIIFEKCSFTTL